MSLKKPFKLKAQLQDIDAMRPRTRIILSGDSSLKNAGDKSMIQSSYDNKSDNVSVVKSLPVQHADLSGQNNPILPNENTENRQILKNPANQAYSIGPSSLPSENPEHGILRVKQDENGGEQNGDKNSASSEIIHLQYGEEQHPRVDIENEGTLSKRGYGRVVDKEEHGYQDLQNQVRVRPSEAQELGQEGILTGTFSETRQPHIASLNIKKDLVTNKSDSLKMDFQHSYASGKNTASKPEKSEEVSQPVQAKSSTDHQQRTEKSEDKSHTGREQKPEKSQDESHKSSSEQLSISKDMKKFLPPNDNKANCFVIDFNCARKPVQEERHPTNMGLQVSGRWFTFQVCVCVRAAKIAAINEEIEVENSKYNDLLQFGFVDAYSNLTYKTIMSLQWSVAECSDIPYVMKTDDDMYINTELIPKMLLAAPKTNFVGGFCWGNSSPSRDASSKWYVPFQTYTRSQFPPMCSGTGYIMSHDVVTNVLKVSENIPFFHLEDVYIALCFKRYGVRPKRIQGFNNMYVQFDACEYRRSVMTSHEVSPDTLTRNWAQIQRCEASTLEPKDLFREVQYPVTSK
ncbi:hypothetical protein C0Q70_03330 [Pomacea canaliculata]|uniref:Hexosyltransferase n=2 Tax=Pomacea canaliculata TaxID=400727 RepID=A0A2T7PSI5_POMCA|nr:hypothetical protein C0Q70_03330 [Pomacea canaliculata]